MDPASYDYRCQRTLLFLPNPTAPTVHKAMSLVVALAVASLLAAASSAAIRVEAYRGEPFGIGKITIDLQSGNSATPWSDDRFALTDAQDRIVYPVTENAPVRRILRSFLGIETPWRVSFCFMFHGDEPLELILHAPEPQQLTIRPENNPREYNELLDDWWDATENRYQQVYRQAEYPIVVENFLTATWARRLGREMPEPRLSFLRRPSWGDAWASKLLANEAYQNSIERDLLLGRFDADEQATIKFQPCAANGQGDRSRMQWRRFARSCRGSSGNDRTNRRPRAARVLLPAVRQLPQLPMVPRFHPPLARRPGQHDRAPERQP